MLKIQCNNVVHGMIILNVFAAPDPLEGSRGVACLSSDNERPIYRLMAGLPDSGNTSSAISLKRCILTGRLHAVGAG